MLKNKNAKNLLSFIEYYLQENPCPSSSSCSLPDLYMLMPKNVCTLFVNG